MPPALSNPTVRSRWPSVLQACAAPVALLAAVLFAYWPALRGGILWDDSAHLTAPSLRSVSRLWRIWSQVGATQQYYPVLHTAFWVEHRLWGDSLLGYHVANVFLHVAAACLFAFVLARIGPSAAASARPRARDWLAAALFALHPVCVESVAWISEQKNTLSAVFYLLAALAYLRFDRVRRWGWYALALALFVLALLSKSVTATLPAALLLVLAWRRGRLAWRGDVLPLLPWFAIGIASGLFTAWVERTYVGARGASYSLGLLERLVLAGRVVWFYLGKVLWPVDLAFIYPRWTVAATAPWILGLVALAGLVGLAWAVRRRTAAPLVALLFFVGSLFPALGFFDVYPFIFSYVADHWQYLACLGIIALVGEGAPQVMLTAAASLSLPARRVATVGAGLLAAALLIVLGLLTRRQAALYRDASTLYRDTLAKNPACWMAHGNLGVILMNEGAVSSGIDHLRAAIRIRPDYADAHNNLGNALALDPGKSDEAVAEFETALRFDPGMAEAHGNLGLALLKKPGRFAEGVNEIRTALRGNEDYPGFAPLHRDLGAALAAVPGRLPEAIAEDEAALRIDPTLESARMDLGIALARSKRPQEAVAHFERILSEHPDSADAHNNLGNSLEDLGRSEEAIGHYRAAVRLVPGSPQAHFNLGRALRNQGDGSEAIAEFREAMRCGADFAAVHNSLGSVLYRTGRFPEAAEEYGKAVSLQPGSASFRNNLGIALTREGNLREAIASLEKAVKLDPGFREARYNLGIALRRAGRTDEAREQFQAAGMTPP